jgi:RpiR family carbohydrate utilization transcriptional regulator
MNGTPAARFQDGSMSFGERIARLHKKRQELIRPVQENPRDYVLMSVRALAEKLATDPATVMRIVQGLGFESYKDFKAYLHELAIANATSLQGMQATVSAGDSNSISQARKALDQDLQNLQALRNTLDMERLASVAERIHRARSILVMGGDMAIALVEFLEYKLTLLGMPVITATTPGKAFHAARNVGKKDLVIAISFRRGLRQTVEGLQRARSNQAFCVGITDTFVSPIARFADASFLTSVEAPFSNSYVAPISLINILFTLCAHHRRARTLAILKKVDQEQRQGYRWYVG